MAAVHLGLAHLLEFRRHTFRSPAFGPVRRRTLIVCQVCPLAAMAAIGEPDAGPGPGPGLGKKSTFGPVRRRTLIVCQVCPQAAMATIEKA